MWTMSTPRFAPPLNRSTYDRTPKRRDAVLLCPDGFRIAPQQKAAKPIAATRYDPADAVATAFGLHEPGVGSGVMARGKGSDYPA